MCINKPTTPLKTLIETMTRTYLHVCQKCAKTFSIALRILLQIGDLIIHNQINIQTYYVYPEFSTQPFL